MLVILFALRLGWLPPSGIGEVQHYILPIFACALGGMATTARLTRSSMLEVIRSDYIVTARAKGLSERKVIYRHALRNALIPVITSAGHMFGIMLGGALVIEVVFSIPGLGTYMGTAIGNAITRHTGCGCFLINPVWICHAFSGFTVCIC